MMRKLFHLYFQYVFSSQFLNEARIEAESEIYRLFVTQIKIQNPEKFWHKPRKGPDRIGNLNFKRCAYPAKNWKQAPKIK